MFQGIDRVNLNRIAIAGTMVFLVFFGVVIYLTDGMMLLRPIKSIYKVSGTDTKESYCRKKENKATRHCMNLRDEKNEHWDSISKSRGKSTAFSLHSK
ncbi:MAG TPA: hypothetical protein PKA63_00530 [Oligoflexia bacterium]|nr:hypothetical protein [Oligoflexia bacterium]HMP47135.1 hypothetical protein [Oligoflexia bacterium]